MKLVAELKVESRQAAVYGEFRSHLSASSPGREYHGLMPGEFSLFRNRDEPYDPESLDRRTAHLSKVHVPDHPPSLATATPDYIPAALPSNVQARMKQCNVVID